MQRLDGIPRIGLLMILLFFSRSTCVATSAVDSTTDDSSVAKLLTLANEHFQNDLKPAEETLLRATANGMIAYCNNGSIRADCLVWLCTNKRALALVTFRGIRISEASIEGTVDLGWTVLSFPFEAFGCTFTGPIVLRNSSLYSLYLERTKIQDLEAERLVVQGNVFLRDGFIANGEVHLDRAKIGEDLDCAAPNSCIAPESDWISRRQRSVAMFS
jgi:hypothetical protein